MVLTKLNLIRPMGRVVAFATRISTKSAPSPEAETMEKASIPRLFEWWYTNILYDAGVEGVRRLNILPWRFRGLERICICLSVVPPPRHLP